MLDIIAGRSEGGRVDGKIEMFGRAYNASERKRKAAFVPQTDLMLPFLTVRETLMMAASLRYVTLTTSCKVPMIVVPTLMFIDFQTVHLKKGPLECPRSSPIWG